MRNEPRVYRISNAGAQALATDRSVPAWYRAILAAINRGQTQPEVVCHSVEAHPPQQVMAWLEELETLGFIEQAA